MGPYFGPSSLSSLFAWGLKYGPLFFFFFLHGSMVGNQYVRIPDCGSILGAGYLDSIDRLDTSTSGPLPAAPLFTRCGSGDCASRPSKGDWIKQ